MLEVCRLDVIFGMIFHMGNLGSWLHCCDAVSCLRLSLFYFFHIISHRIKMIHPFRTVMVLLQILENYKAIQYQLLRSCYASPLGKFSTLFLTGYTSSALQAVSAISRNGILRAQLDYPEG